MMELKIRITHAMQVFALARGTKEEFEVAIAAALEELKADGVEDPMDIFFHTFSYHGEYNCFMSPHGDALYVDLSDTSETLEVESGPFAGKIIKVPRPFSEGDE